MSNPPATQSPHLLELDKPALREHLKAVGEKPFRADQLMDWVWKKNVTTPGRMSNVPDTLAGRLPALSSRVVEIRTASDKTAKLLVELADGLRVETVLIPSGKRATACLSTQVGCAMGCGFCATAMDGLARNLSGGEILEQILHLRTATGREVTNAVFMGMGEPLANYDATLKALRALIDPDRLGISARSVTVSTIGLPGPIRRLAGEELPVTLAISLHAPTDRLRRRIIPSAGEIPIERIISAAREFYQSRHREVTLEYLLIAEFNDTPECVEALAEIAGRLRCNVNLIRYNPVPSLPWRRPSRQATEAFAAACQARGVNVTVRSSRGLEADAACGQLRQRHQQAGPTTDTSK
jgi:23S rRNA (adenine2503-C2)-methyltransferase